LGSWLSRVVGVAGVQLAETRSCVAWEVGEMVRFFLWTLGRRTRGYEFYFYHEVYEDFLDKKTNFIIFISFMVHLMFFMA